MKKVLLIIISTFCFVNLFAQEENVTLQASEATLKTALQVTVTVKKESIKTGPYARYAQQYLGVNAPLNDNVTYSIESGAVSVIEGNGSDNDYVCTDVDMDFVDMGLGSVVTSAGDVQADITGIGVMSAKMMAMEAANTIFTIRKRRLDVITGESQDTYGEGLTSAIQEMNRIEQQYINLFMGKKSVTFSQYTFGVIPAVGESNYIICRFSSEKGLLDILSNKGKHIALLLNPENSIQLVDLSSYKGNKNEITKIKTIPDWTTATLVHDGTPITTTMVKVLQYGKMVISEY